MCNKIKERIREIISNNTDDTIIIIWISEDIANSYKDVLSTEYLKFVRECSIKRKIETYGESLLPTNFELFATQPSKPICIGATVEALSNSDSFFDEVIYLCNKYNFSYIKIL